jgi:hypothetical protein
VNSRCSQRIALAQTEVDNCRSELERCTTDFSVLSSSLAQQARAADAQVAEITAAHGAAQAKWEALVRAAQDDANRALTDGASTNDQWSARFAQDRADAQRSREELRQAMEVG